MSAGPGARGEAPFKNVERQLLTRSVYYVNLADMKDAIREIGAGLAEYAKGAEFTAQRGLVAELFPYIWIAARRMSIRAIVRWLEAKHGVRISVESVARAMRAPEEQWADMVEEIEPAAHIFGDAHDVEPAAVLDNEELFRALELRGPTVRAAGPEDAEKKIAEYGRAAGTLRGRWFCYPAEIRAECRRHVGIVFGEEIKEEREHGKRRSKRPVGK